MSFISRIIGNSKRKANVFVVKVAFETFSRVIMKNPVDTGRARANWQAEIGRMPSGTTDNVDQGQEGNSASDGSGTSSTKDKMLGVVTAGKAGDVFYLANNLPYIQRLEDGHSKQTPAGMVKVTLTEIEQIIKAASK